MMDSINQSLIEGWQRLCQRIARFTSYDFPDVDAEDIEGELYVFLTERNLWDKDPETQGFAYALQRRANWHAWQERKEQLSRTSQYSYRTRDISIVLETMFDYSLWVDAFVPDDAKSNENSRDTDGIDLSVDLSWAYDRLSDEHKQAIFNRYVLHNHPEKGTAEYKRLSRAKTKMADILNNYWVEDPEGPSTRKVRSNASMNAKIRMERDGQG